jgi:hypothetical protein
MKKRTWSVARYRMSWASIVPIIWLLGGCYPTVAYSPGRQLPEFPWPPPHASAFQVVPRNLLIRQEPSTLGDIVKHLEDALNSNGYTELSYFAVPRGVAIVTQMEEINEDGTSKQLPDRWAAEVPVRISLSALIRSLFQAKPGRFRIITFIATSVPFAQDTAIVSRDEATDWLSRGANVLPPELSKRSYSSDYNTTAVIYEFEKPTRDQAAVLAIQGSLTGMTHLEKAGILPALRR